MALSGPAIKRNWMQHKFVTDPLIVLRHVHYHSISPTQTPYFFKRTASCVSTSFYRWWLFRVFSLLVCTGECHGQESAPAASGEMLPLLTKILPRFTYEREGLLTDRRDQRARVMALKIIEGGRQGDLPR